MSNTTDSVKTHNSHRKSGSNALPRRILQVLIVATIAFAWIHSAMPVVVSQSESGFFLDFLKPFLRLFIKEEYVTDHLIRKLAHFSEYGALGLEMCAYLVFLTSKWKESFGRTRLGLFANVLLTGLVIAFLDETIQIFSGRGPLISDVWIDLAGYTLGTLVILLVNQIKKKHDKQLEEAASS